MREKLQTLPLTQLKEIAKSQGMKQLMAGLGLILLAIVLVPVLEGMMTGAV